MYQLPHETLVSDGAVCLIARRQGRLKEKDTVQKELLEKYGLQKESEMCTSEDSESTDSEMEDVSEDESESTVSDPDDSSSDESMSSESESTPPARQRKCTPARKGRNPKKKVPTRRKPTVSIMYY